eukprot:5731907-Pyramimonas_sp.AAC.1
MEAFQSPPAMRAVPTGIAARRVVSSSRNASRSDAGRSACGAYTETKADFRPPLAMCNATALPDGENVGATY